MGYNLLYWGYNPFAIHLLTSWDIQVHHSPLHHHSLHLARWSWWTKRAITCNNYDPRWEATHNGGNLWDAEGNKETGSVGMMVKDVDMVMFERMEAESFYRIVLYSLYILARFWFQ